MNEDWRDYYDSFASFQLEFLKLTAKEKNEVGNKRDILDSKKRKLDKKEDETLRLLSNKIDTIRRPTSLDTSNYNEENRVNGFSNPSPGDVRCSPYLSTPVKRPEVLSSPQKTLNKPLVRPSNIIIYSY